MELKDWVKAARKRRGWTLAELGEFMGRSKSNVGMWESGTHQPSYAQILSIAAVTGFPLPHEVQLDAQGEVIWTGASHCRDGDVSVTGSAVVILDKYFFKPESPTTAGALRGIHLPNAYAVRMDTGTLAPIVKRDDFLVLRQLGELPPSFGDFCVVSTTDGQVRFAEFVNLQEESWTFANGHAGGPQQTFNVWSASIQQLDIVLATVSKALWRPSEEQKSSNA
ncbi:MAG: helix-turn-helix transcriptional regulator [Pseudacidovorax sp.]|uniref:helix-turn-helix transcriptional regulator n=1 Tax=Pseudacidovorax sp. TaxID=1934311 RepID=UPI001B54FE65|nr:helix-turn-helix transcriptional regulator [Pseudacidovorax sp.]MBP6897322.1 helix-turn-helix transcriptional regulator [Pseudacidovorax sp.]